MTTRAQLESERDALVDLRARQEHAAIRQLGIALWSGDFSHEGNREHAECLRNGWRYGYDALTASIARVEALLSLSDDMANNIAQGLAVRATMVTGVDIAHGCRTVAEIVRRS